MVLVVCVVCVGFFGVLVPCSGILRSHARSIPERVMGVSEGLAKICSVWTAEHRRAQRMGLLLASLPLKPHHI